jgi:hypothetical protein
MTLIKRVVVASYETTDGKTFTDKTEAAKHQANLKRLDLIEDAVFEKLLKRWADDKFNQFSPIPNVSVNQIANFILDNADALREILPKRAKSIANEATPVEQPQTIHINGDAPLAMGGVIGGFTAESVSASLTGHVDVVPNGLLLNGNVSDAALATV